MIVARAVGEVKGPVRLVVMVECVYGSAKLPDSSRNKYQVVRVT